MSETLNMLRTCLGFLAATALFASCSNSSSNAAPEAVVPQGADADFVFTNNGDAALASLVVTVTEARVERDGIESASLLPMSLPVELVSSNGEAEWLLSSLLEPGTYESVTLVLDPAETTARGLDGQPLFVTLASHKVRVELSPALVVAESGYHRFELALDLDAALEINDAGVLVDLASGFELSVTDGSTDLSLDEIVGVVTIASLPDKALVLETFANAHLDEPLGPVGVLIDDATTLVDAEEREFDSVLDFLANLQIGVTALRVQGRLGAQGELFAERIVVIDPNSSPLVRIEGRVVAFNPEDRVFTLLIGEIEAGHDIVLDVLEQIGGPLVIDVAYDDSTHFLGDDDADDLAVGLFIEVEFEEFDTEPFLASTIELEDDCVSLSGRVVDTSDLPDFIQVELSDDLPVLDGIAKVLTVALDGAEITLDSKGDPELEADQILAGTRVKLRGCLAGVLSGSEFDADSIEVRPGEFDKAVVAAIVPGEHLCETASSRVKQPFSFQLDKHDEGPLEVVIDPRAVFTKDAHSEEQFYALFEGLENCPLAKDMGNGHDDDDDDDGGHGHGHDHCSHLEVRVKGVGTDVPHRVIAFEVRVQKKHK